MDSGDSHGSMQSSSGGDEEYDSVRAESIPTFINPPGHYSSISNPQPPFIFSQNQNHQSDLLMDLSSNYHHAFSQSQVNSYPKYSMLNLDAVPSSPQLRPVHDDDGSARAPAQPNVGRISKKRKRATRRAPATTVLTTDTSNFRAMVQEFTGIPSPPFSSSPAYSSRLDLFGSSYTLRPSSGTSEPVGVHYPLRPSPKKAYPSPFLSTAIPASTFLNNTLGDASTIASRTANSKFITVNNFHQIPSSLDLSNPLLNLSGFDSPSPGSVMIPFLEELGMRHGHVNVNDLSGLPNHELAGSNNGRDDQDHLRSNLDDGNCGKSASVDGCKLNYSAPPSSGFINHEKHFLNMSARDEGTVDSWICPSD